MDGVYAWEPQPGPQAQALGEFWIDELFFGGARGGGKSDYLLGDYLSGIKYGSRWPGILFRKTYDELEELQLRAMQIYPKAGGVYKMQRSAEYPFSNCWYFPTGATLKMRYLEHERDAARYQGHQYAWAGFDELTNWPTLTGYNMIKGCVRTPRDGGPKIPSRIRASGNPGGKGHIEVKARFVDIAPPGTPYLDEETGLSRMFVPSRIQDNKYLADDPQYIAMIKSAGSKELVKAWLEGDWDVVAGAYFDCFERSKHVIRPFEIPGEWLRFRAFDWGSSKPFSVGWWAMVGDYDGPLPKGALVKYREWYGAEAPNVGLKMHADDVARGIINREAGGEKIRYSVADPSCWKVDGGPSIAERMFAGGVNFRKADNGRLNGWDQLRSRMVGEDDKPMIYWFNTCVDSIRTIPLLQHDEKHPEDLDSDMEDHAADETRYACMSRPWQPRKAEKKQPKWLEDQTVDELYNEQLRKRRLGEWD